MRAYKAPQKNVGKMASLYPSPEFAKRGAGRRGMAHAGARRLDARSFANPAMRSRLPRILEEFQARSHFACALRLHVEFQAEKIIDHFSTYTSFFS
ncbi:MAG: hypothetical protein ACLGP3_13030 [Acidobacteriota bacterium]